MKKTIIIIISSVVLIALVIGLIAIVSSDEEGVNDNIPVSNEQPIQQENKAPSKVDENEEDVSNRKAQELFNFIPKVYTEGITPFDSAFMLDSVMKKIIDTNENQDFSVVNVDNMVKKIFGEAAVIDKDEVSNPDVAKSLFYYSKEAKSYAVIPVGYSGKFEYQIFKNATETDTAYYVYTYTLIGGYSYDESSIIQDEFGDVSYENAKVQVIVGDKDGNDLVHIFDNYNSLYDESIWMSKYSNIMPIFRYTLTKIKGGYYLTEVEQINY